MEKFVITFVGAFIAFAIWDVIKSIVRKRSGGKQNL